MRRLLLACSILAVCASGEIRPPSVISEPKLPPGAISASLAPPATTCGDLGAYVAKWQALLSLRDWTVLAECKAIPASEGAAALSYPNPWRREVEIIVDPNGGDAELLVLHELAHALFATTCEAKSEVVEEQIVVALSELLKRLEKER